MQNGGFRKLIYPLVMQLSKTRVRNKLVICNVSGISTDSTVIYAVNHTNSSDIPLACRAAGKHCSVLIGKQPLFFSDKLFFWLNGAVWVDRKDKQDMHRAKEDMIRLLRKKQSVIWFPEGTWNQSDNLLMLPMKWGIIDVAQISGVRIVPIVLEYDKVTNQCLALIGKAMNPDEYSLFDGINYLRDSMATLRWMAWEENGQRLRAALDVDKERQSFRQDIEDYPPLDWDYEQSIIFHPK